MSEAKLTAVALVLFGRNRKGLPEPNANAVVWTAGVTR